MTVQDACSNREWDKWFLTAYASGILYSFTNILCTDQIYAWSVQRNVYFMKYRITVQTSKTLAVTGTNDNNNQTDASWLNQTSKVLTRKAPSCFSRINQAG